MIYEHGIVIAKSFFVIVAYRFLEKELFIDTLPYGRLAAYVAPCLRDQSRLYSCTYYQYLDWVYGCMLELHEKTSLGWIGEKKV